MTSVSENIFGELFREYSRELFWIAYAFSTDREMAEDAVQEAFLRLWEQQSNGADVRNVRSYLIRTAKNYITDQFRKKQLYNKHEDAMTEDIENTLLDEYDEEEYNAMLRKAQALVASLPEACRRIFVKYAIEGMSYKGIATSENISVNTVKAQLRIAHKKLNRDVPLFVFLMIEVFQW